MMELIGYSFACAVIGFVYSDVLTEPGMILRRLYKWLEKKLMPTDEEGNPEYGQKEWLFKPIIGCFRCVAGQIAFWSYFIIFPSYRIGEYVSLHSVKLLLLNIFFHAFYITLTIFISWMISKLYRVNI